MSDYQKMRALVAKHLGVKSEEVQPGADLTGDLGADSLDTIELVMVMEEKFNIDIPDEVAVRVQTVSDLHGAILKGKSHD